LDFGNKIRGITYIYYKIVKVDKKIIWQSST